MFSGGIEKDQWHEMGLSVPNIECAGQNISSSFFSSEYGIRKTFT